MAAWLTMTIAGNLASACAAVPASPSRSGAALEEGAPFLLPARRRAPLRPRPHVTQGRKEPSCPAVP